MAALSWRPLLSGKPRARYQTNQRSEKKGNSKPAKKRHFGNPLEQAVSFPDTLTITRLGHRSCKCGAVPFSDQSVCAADNPTPQTGVVTAILSKLETISLARGIAFLTAGREREA